MFTSRVVPRLTLLRRATCALQPHGESFNGCVQSISPSAHWSLQFLNQKLRNYSTAADNSSSPQWVQLEPDLEDALVPRKLSVSPLESWLSLRYSLPSLESALPQEDVNILEEKVLPPLTLSVLEDEESPVTPLSCKNVLEIRRRKMNGHKYRKLQKRMRFVKRRVLRSRKKRKQKKFERDLRRIWKGAGLKKPREGWNLPKVFADLKRKKWT